MNPIFREKHKFLLPWIALVGGALGLHRFYLFGIKDWFGWLHVPFALAGAAGVVRARNLGLDDHVSWALMPLLGIALAVGLLGGIVYTLRDDERFNAQFNAGKPITKMSWAAVLGVVACLIVGGTVTMATIAFSFQKYFESQL
jgi:TM2 domain-containing membrane protein YozV